MSLTFFLSSFLQKGATTGGTVRKQVAVVAIFFTLLAAHCHQAFAQVPPLGVTPIEVQHTVARPGSRLTDQFIVTNGGDVPMFVSGYTSDWTVAKTGNIAFQEPGTNPQSCAAWIQLVPPSFSIPPKGQVTVRYTISTPPTLTAEHHALVFFECRPLPAKGNNNMNLLIAARIGCKIFVAPAQPLALQGKLSGISLLPAPDNKLAINFENTGSGHLRANGTIEARDANGQVVAKGELLPPNVQMTAGTNVDLTPKWDRDLAAGTYTMRAVVDYGAKTLAGGEVKVEIPDMPLPVPVPAEGPKAPAVPAAPPAETPVAEAQPAIEPAIGAPTSPAVTPPQ